MSDFLYKKRKRIRILSPNEIRDLFDRPTFTDEEFLVWFELNQTELNLLKTKASLTSKVDLT